LIILVFFALMYFMSVRPQQQRAKRRLEMIRSLQAGDEIITDGGIYGEVKSLDAERVRLEVDADVEIVVARRAIASVVPAEADDELETAADAEADELPAGAGEPAQEPAEEGRAAR
jgi:preprotein translocase subunit YajC